MSKDVTNFINQCHVCLSYDKTPSVSHPAQATVASAFNEKVGMDCVFGLEKSSDNYVGLVVLTDYFTKWPEAYAIKSKEATEIASKFLIYIGNNGAPKEIISDQGREFVNACVDRVNDILGIIRRTTSACNPRAHGQTERFNQTLVGALKKTAAHDPENWPKYLPFVLMADRSRVHSSTGFSPFMLKHGVPMRGFDPQGADLSSDQLDARGRELKQLFEGLIPLAQASLSENKERVESQDLPVGSKVYVKNSKMHNKSEVNFSGPYTVAEVTNNKNYVLKDKESNQQLAGSVPRNKIKQVKESTKQTTRQHAYSSQHDYSTNGKSYSILDHLYLYGRTRYEISSSRYTKSI